MTETWKHSVLSSLYAFSKVPDNFIPGCSVDPTATGPAITKYRCLFEVNNTPFLKSGHGLGPIKRLWMYLVRQDRVQNFFIKFIFGRKAKAASTALNEVHFACFILMDCLEKRYLFILYHSPFSLEMLTV